MKLVVKLRYSNSNRCRPLTAKKSKKRFYQTGSYLLITKCVLDCFRGVDDFTDVGYHD